MGGARRRETNEQYESEQRDGRSVNHGKPPPKRMFMDHVETRMDYHRSPTKIWSSLACALALLMAGCAEGAKLAQRDENGGVVTYPFKHDHGHMLSSFRKDALALMNETCSAGYVIVREGEARGRARVAGAIEGGKEIVRERRWGIEFRCK